MLKKINNKGFTIIEVLIVLAIAGMIMLIVFLAVPALQRNSRNTQRKSDVSQLSAAFTEYLNNNQGTVPASCTGATPCAWLANAKTGIYDTSTATSFTFTKQATATQPTSVSDPGVINMYNFAKCSGNTPTAAGATNRSVVILYAVETGSATPTAQCLEL